MNRMMHRIKELKNYAFGKEYIVERTIRFATLSAILNAFLALFRIGMGFYTRSPLYCVYGIYHAGIGIAKYTTANKPTQGEERKNYKTVGLIVFITCMVYVLYCSKMVICGEGNIYRNAATAIMLSKLALLEVGKSIFCVFNTWSLKNLTVLAAKRINLVTALVSLVLTLSTFLEMNGFPIVARYNGWVGLFVGFVSALIGLQMMFQKTESDRATSNPVSINNSLTEP